MATTKRNTEKAKTADAQGQPADPEVENNVNRDLEQGFRGVAVDETPNENYTVQGVTSGAPTPESQRSNGE